MCARTDSGVAVAVRGHAVAPQRETFPSVRVRARYGFGWLSTPRYPDYYGPTARRDVAHGVSVGTQTDTHTHTLSLIITMCAICWLRCV